MAGQLEIRVVKEALIAELEWMNHPSRKDYFKTLGDAIGEGALCRVCDQAMEKDFRRLQRVLWRIQKCSDFYYRRACETLGPLLNSKELCAWTRKETLEAKEAVEECWDREVQERFLPLFSAIQPQEVLLLYLVRQNNLQ